MKNHRIIAILAGLLVPALCLGRQTEARVLIDQLAQACQAYEMDHTAHPPGDGSGSSSLAAALSRPGPRQIPFQSPALGLRPSPGRRQQIDGARDNSPTGRAALRPASGP